MTNLAIRPLVAGDLPSIKSILRYWIRNPETGRMLPREIRNALDAMSGSLLAASQRTYLVAREGSEAIGVMGLAPISKAMLPFATERWVAELVHAYVHPDRRGQGVGTALLEGIRAHATTAACTSSF